MKKITFCLMLFCISFMGCAQSPDVITTLILVRHAEKATDGTKDPGLTEEGMARAEVLVKVLGETKVDAIYSTPYKRTTDTVVPLAKSKGLAVINYEPMNGDAMDKLLQSHKGKTIVVSGHSNTTPWVVNYFLGKDELADFNDSDYDNLIVLSVLKKGNAKITWLNYGNLSN